MVIKELSQQKEKKATTTFAAGFTAVLVHSSGSKAFPSHGPVENLSWTNNNTEAKQLPSQSNFLF